MLPHFIYFFQIKPIANLKKVLKILKNVNMDISLLISLLDIIHLLEKRQRKIRSLSGFFKYALDLLQKQNCKILATNLEPLFWLKIEQVLQQNRKESLEFSIF